MGWLSSIAKIGAIGGAPFTGGASLGLLPAIDAVGNIAGGAAKGAANERAMENQRQANVYDTQQRSLLQALGLDERATMDRAQLGIAAPQARAKQALLGSLMQRMQKANVQPPPGIRMGQVSGGIGDAIGGSGAKMAGILMQLQALKAMQSGSDVPAATNYAQKGMLPPPEYKKAGKGESIMSLLGLVGGGIGALGGAMQQKPPVNYYNYDGGG
jgi:hypothetical protein